MPSSVFRAVLNSKGGSAVHPWGIVAVGLYLGLAVAPATAERTQVLFEFKNWVVEGVTTDDNSYLCRATVSVPGDSFSIRPLKDKTVRLEFFSDEWDFGEGETASLVVAIDHGAPSTFAGATLLKSSVFVDLSGPDASNTFVHQVARGKMLHLRTASGTDVRTYSLSGSAQAILNLGKCDQTVIPDRNPFN
ncbi:MAG: hypothetical protein ABI832_06650 [bacterium]